MYNKPSKNCPFNVKTYEECKKNFVSEVYPNGKPTGTGILDQIEHYVVMQPNCFCDYAIEAILNT